MEKPVFAVVQLIAVFALLAFLYFCVLIYSASDVGQMNNNYICLPNNMTMIIYPNGYSAEGYAVDYVNKTFYPHWMLYGKQVNQNVSFCVEWKAMNQCAKNITISNLTTIKD